MKPAEELHEDFVALRERLSRLSEARLRINERLDLDIVLQHFLDSARALTEARYVVITLLEAQGEVEDFSHLRFWAPGRFSISCRGAGLSVSARKPSSREQGNIPSRIVAPDRSAIPVAATRIPYQSSWEASAASLDERKVMLPAPA